MPARFKQLIVLSLLSILAILVTAQARPVLAGDLIWSQIDDGNTDFGPSVDWPGHYNQEVADDFDIVGAIERIFARGYGCFQCDPPTVQGVYVRFYEHTLAGPGALQQEQFIPAGDPGFIYNAANPSALDITLPTPFNASGKHFFSVQMVMDDSWSWWESNKNNPTLSRIYIRDQLQGEEWHIYDFAGFGNADVAFDLYGKVTGAPVINSLSDTSLDRSGRLRIFGTNFGEEQGSGQVLIGGVPTIVGTWSGSVISAYVPETVGPGTVSVQVTSASGSSNMMELDVSLRQVDGRLKWRFQAEGFYSIPRPAVGPDGTIYVVSVHGTLYALTPDGGLKWLVKGAGGQGVDVAPDGTIYAGNESVITAVNPDGSIKWVYNQNPRAFILLGPSVGPDGNIYAVASSGMGIFSLTPQGELRWTYPEQYSRPITTYQEIEFGYNGSTLQLYFHANDHFRGLTADGDLVFSTSGGSGNPEVGPDQTIYNQMLLRYDPDGNVIDVFVPPIPNSGGTAPHVSQSTGNVYQVQADGGTLRSFTPDLDVRWERSTQILLGNPYPDPTDRVVAMHAAEDFGMSGFVAGMSTVDGQELWRVNWQDEQGLIQFGSSNPRFTDDGNTLYINSLLAGEPADRVFYLNAIDSSPDGAPACSENCLRSTAVQFGYRPYNGETAVVARVTVKDETGAPVVGATVEATLTLPDGTIKAGTWVSNSKGYAFFGDLGGPGEYTLTVDDISLAGKTFDTENSLLSKSYTLPVP